MALSQNQNKLHAVVTRKKVITITYDINSEPESTTCCSYMTESNYNYPNPKFFLIHCPEYEQSISKVDFD